VGLYDIHVAKVPKKNKKNNDKNNKNIVCYILTN
jgi:hypothetical protein